MLQNATSKPEDFLKDVVLSAKDTNILLALPQWPGLGEIPMQERISSLCASVSALRVGHNFTLAHLLRCALEKRSGEICHKTVHGNTENQRIKQIH